VAENDDAEEPARLSERLDGWLDSDHPKNVAGLVETFGPQSFAIVFVFLLAPSALPLPTGGVTQVLEIIAILLALELLVGRREVWIPKRWERRELKGVTGPRFRRHVVKRIEWFERWSRPRLAHLLELRVTSVVFGVLVLAFTLGAVVAPPLSGLDTLPSLGVVVLSLGVLLRDAVVAAAGIVVGVAGIAVLIGLGHAITRLI
jgi:hypothetical protein